MSCLLQLQLRTEEMNSEYTAEVHFSKYSYHNVFTTWKTTMLLGNRSTVQFLHCKALLLSIMMKTWKDNQNIGSLQLKVIFACDFDFYTPFCK